MTTTLPRPERSPRTTFPFGPLFPFVPLVDSKAGFALKDHAFKAGAKTMEVLAEANRDAVNKQFDMMSSSAQRVAAATKTLSSVNSSAELVTVPLDLLRSHIEAALTACADLAGIARDCGAQVSALHGALWSESMNSFRQPRAGEAKGAGESGAATNISRVAE